jgi:hypothetical protein
MVITDALAETGFEVGFFVRGEELDPRVSAIAISVEAGPHPAKRICDSGLLA